MAAEAESDSNQNGHSEVLGTDDSEKIKSGVSPTSSEFVGMINLFKKPYKKKAGKFQPFKKLFGKRKKREPVSDFVEAKLKPSHSFGNVCNGTFSSDEETNGLRSSHYSMGSRAFSHDSIFIPDGRTESEQAIQAMSQENVLGKVKTLQQQLAKNIKFGQPPQMTISVRTMGEASASMEEDVLLSSPMETETQQETVIPDSGNKSTDTPDFLRTMNLPGTGYEVEEKVTPVKSSRPKRQFSCSGTIETINLDAVPQAVARLDNSAAKHKLSVKPKKQRMSRKHKRLTKGSQSLTITEFEPEDLETPLYGDGYPGYNGHIIIDKLIQNRDEQKQLQLAEEKRIEDHWGIVEAERIRQIVEMEEQREMEEKRCQELEQMQKEQERRCFEKERRQHLFEGERSLKTEEQTCHKEESRPVDAEKNQELEEQRHQELEKQRQKELEQELEKQKHQEQEHQHKQELEEQKHQEQEHQHKQELEEQKHLEQEDQQRQELEKQKHQQQEEQQRQELEEQKHLEQEEQQRQELEEQKHQQQEEQQRQELEKQKHQEQEKQQRQELEKQKHQEQERQQRQELEKQKHQDKGEQQRQELEEQMQQRQELEEQKCWEPEEQRHQELEEQKHQEWEEQRHEELEEQKSWQPEEQRHQELKEQKHQEWGEQRHEELEEQQRQELEKQKRLELGELRQHEIDKQCQQKEEGNWMKEQKELKEKKQRRELEEKKLQEAEIKPKQEKEAESIKQIKQEEQRQLLKEKEEKTEKEQSQQVMDKKKKREDQRKHKLTKQMHMESAEGLQQYELTQQREQSEQEWKKLEEQKIETERQNLQQNKKNHFEQQQGKDQLCSGGDDRHPVEEKLQEGSRSQKHKQLEKGNKTAEEVLAQKLKREVEAQEQKRIGEELRWQEVDERQTASRPFTFQVSSGDKQIIFQKVNLSPVMPVKGPGLSSPSNKDCRLHTASKGSHTLPSSVCVPHTAILVTGAQLCGTAVNLNQIKDTACKSLLGLSEEKKTVEIPSPEKTQRKTQDPKSSSSKMKYAQESLNNQAVLAEWASIRSRILKNAENSKYERDRVSVCRHSDDWTPRGRGAPHGNLRKTLSANAKFSITPAWQKFSDSSKANSDAENVNVAKGKEAVAGGTTTGLAADSKEGVASTFKDNLVEKAKEKMETQSEMTDNTEGCKFAKDLPSFLVPSFPHSPGKELPQAELPSALENQQNNGTKKADKPAPNGEENVSPFGIKLRRTNYSLRFHYDQQAEQRKKKRYSAGDSFDGVPDPIVATEGEKESTVFAPQESTSPGRGRVNIPGHLKDSKDSSVTVAESSQPAGTSVVPPTTTQSALPPHEKPACRSVAPQKPALAPKPTSQTPPPSPLSKINRSSLAGTLGQRFVKAESDSGWRKEDRANAVHPTLSNEYKNEEEEIREKKSFFPSISIPWREKNDKKPEPLKKEKPVLQSRHSLDGSKFMEKVESSQPLWITLALQKQKGFREQQATREERRQAREAKQAEKLAKENAAVSNQSDNKSSSSKTSTLQKSTTQEGEKKTETAVSRLERREQLKKSNTLPTSVTVEISDSVPSTPLAKEVAKRFSTPDANPVSTEPAWLALAKRKAKAWSDCPQIIK